MTSDLEKDLQFLFAKHRAELLLRAQQEVVRSGQRKAEGSDGPMPAGATTFEARCGDHALIVDYLCDTEEHLVLLGGRKTSDPVR